MHNGQHNESGFGHLVGSMHFGRHLERLVNVPLPQDVHDGMNWI